MSKIEFIKDDTCEVYETRWFIEVDGKDIGEITKECEFFAHATSRARGTKVVSYTVSFDDGQDETFHANGNARAAFKAATEYAAKIIGGAA